MSDEKQGAHNIAHIMVDIETLGTMASRHPVICLGAIQFFINDDEKNVGVERVMSVIDAHSVSDEHMFFQIYNIEDQMAQGKKVDIDTMMWWIRSPNQVKMLNNWLQSNVNQQLLTAKLQNFSAWVHGLRPAAGDVMLWSYGMFDVAFIQEMYRCAGLSFPFHYRALGDVRSVKRVYEFVHGQAFEKDEQNEYAHHPLMDCYQQIQAMRRIIANLR